MNSFQGFSKKTVKFYQSLAKNNNKIWFDKHKPEYEEHVLNPAREFVVVLGDRLRKIAPEIHAEPKVNKSIFRIYRDVRFSKDKSPYKTNLGLWFWEGTGKRMECSGFYFQIEPPNLFLGVGYYMFPKHFLSIYRDAVVDPKLGQKLRNSLNSIKKRGDYKIGGAHYKKVPRGYSSDHPNADLLLHNGLHVGMETKIPDAFYSPEIVEYCFGHFQSMAPLHKWLYSLTER